MGLMKMNRMGRLAVLAAGLVSAAQPAMAGVTSGMLLTNCATATYALPSGAGVFETDPGVNSINIPNSCTAWVLVTDQPQLCMRIWKTGITFGSWAPTTGAYPGTIVCFQIGFSNCGNFSGMSVHLTDMMPSNAVRSTLPPGPVWVSGTPSPVKGSATWATALGGPWNPFVPFAQQSPHYMRWILEPVGMHKTGYIRYCVTIL